MKTAINQTVKTREVCGHQGADVHEWPTYKDGRDKTEYQCDDYEACLTRKQPQLKAIKWLVARCSCGETFEYPEGGYKPKTCGTFECVQKYLHPELRSK